MTECLIWVVGAIGAIIVTIWIPKKLAWQLFVFVPLVHEAVLVLCANLFGFHGVPLLPLLISSYFYISVLFYWAYGLFFHGGWAVLFGGLGYLAARSVFPHVRFSQLTLVLDAAACIVMALLYTGIVISSDMSRAGSAYSFTLGWPLIPPLIAGLFGGLLIAYYFGGNIPQPRGVQGAT
jgi:hypothetical protein